MVTPARAAGSPEWFVNPGIKLGYTWGPGGGFTIGLEVSALGMEFVDEFMYGPVVSIDYRWARDFRLRLGGEVCRMGFGAEGGVVASYESGRLRFGLAATPWFGAVLVPYYTFTLMFDGDYSHEMGGYAKVPLMYYSGTLHRPLDFPYAD
jgi:hypothetical protein